MIYAVQYRDMHTALHHLRVYGEKAQAEEALSYALLYERMPHDSCLDDYRIDYKDVPTDYKGKKLNIVNTGPVPDCY